MAVPEIAKLDEVDPRYIEAARLRILEGKTWGEVAEALDVTQRTVYDWRQTVDWQRAVLGTLTLHAGQYTEIALGRLASSAQGEPGGPGVSAANSLLDRMVGSVTQKHGGDPNNPIEHRHTFVVEQFGKEDGGGGNREPGNGEEGNGEAGDGA